MTWTTWGWYVLTEAVLSLSPGPAVLFVVAQALLWGRRQGVWASLGISSANAVYFLLLAVGLNTVLVASHALFSVVKWIGAAYLIYLGLKTFLGHGEGALVAGHVQDGQDGPRPGGGVRTWVRGVMLEFANPKAFLFFTALVPQFIRPDLPIVPQIGIIGTTSIIVELIILFAYSALAGRMSHMAQRPRFVKVTNRVSGALLVGAGAGIALAGER